MRKTLSHELFLLFFLWVAALMAYEWSYASEEETWWEKPEKQKLIQEERQILVSVKNNLQKGPHDYLLTGVGALRAPLDFALKKFMDFESLPKVSSYFKKVVHQPELHRVYIVVEAYGYEARMLLKYSVHKTQEASIFDWQVVWGGFQDMVGSVKLTALTGGKTQALVRSSFDDKALPLPPIFKNFVLELLTQQVAKSMRSYIEDDYQKQKSA